MSKTATAEFRSVRTLVGSGKGPVFVVVAALTAVAALITGAGLVPASGATDEATLLGGRLELIDASTDDAAMLITDNTASITLFDSPADGYGFNYDGAPPGTESMRFAITGPVNYSRLENYAPYSAFGNRGPDHWGRTLVPGVYNIVVEAFSADRAGGVSLGTQLFSFEVLGDDGTAPTTSPPSTIEVTTTTTEAPTTTKAPTTTEAPTTTAAPTTTEAPTTTLGPGIHPDIVQVIDVAGRNPGRNWHDSYSVDDKCYCATTFDHDIGDIEVQTPAGTKTVREVCEAIGDGPGIGDRPRYNDIQCGNGPANNAGDEDDCPGRVDVGREGCGHIGPTWDLSVFD